MHTIKEVETRDKKICCIFKTNSRNISELALPVSYKPLWGFCTLGLSSCCRRESWSNDVAMKYLLTPINISTPNRSMRWLCTDFPVNKGFICSVVCTYSKGVNEPLCSFYKALQDYCCLVVCSTFKNLCITNFHFINLRFPCMCLKIGKIS